MNNKFSAKKTYSGIKSFFSGNVLLSAGLAVFFFGAFSLCYIFADAASRRLYIIPVLVVAAGIVSLYRVLSASRRSWLVFMACACISCGFLLLVIEMDLLPYEIKQLWPIFVVLCGISLFIAGINRFRAFRPVFMVPSVALTGSGLFYMLFSLYIIKERFMNVVTRWWPVLFVAAGLFLVGVYMYREYSGKSALSKDNGGAKERNE